MVNFGIFLEDELGEKTLPQRLLISLAVVELLKTQISKNLISLDFCPENLLYNRKKNLFSAVSSRFVIPEGQLKLHSKVDFKNFTNPAYLTPEHTGKGSSEPCRQTPFYSLGILLYKILTNSLPYEGKDLLDWSYAHLSLNPRPVFVADFPNIETPLSQILLHLLNKHPHLRYASMNDLESDLKKVMDMTENPSLQSSLHLKAPKLKERLILSSKTYGRDEEISLLQQKFSHFTEKKYSQLFLISGEPGSGKTTVVNEAFKNLKGLTILRGKFDQYQRGLPYEGILQAIKKELPRIILKQDSQHSPFRDKIESLSEKNKTALFQLLPEIGQFADEHNPQLKSHDRNDAVNSPAELNTLFSQLISFIAEESTAMIVFLDDIQWADNSSLSFIQEVMEEWSNESHFLVCAVRDNEIEPNTYLEKVFRDLSVKPQTTLLQMKDLSKKEISELLKDSFELEEPLLGDLTQVIWDKTNGNPFFASSMIREFFDSGLLFYEPREKNWLADLEACRALPHTDNVLELISKNVNQLDEAKRNALNTIACIGEDFSTKRLAKILQISEWDTKQLLNFFFEHKILKQNFHGKQEINFYHDKIQQVCYGLCDEREIKKQHLVIAQELLSSSDRPSETDATFRIIAHLEHIEQSVFNEHPEYLEMYLQGARKSMAAGSFELSTRLYQKILKSFSSDNLQPQNLLESTIALEACESFLNSSRYEECLQVLEQQENCLSGNDDLLIECYRIRALCFNALGRHTAVIENAQNALKLIGYNIKPIHAGTVLKTMAYLFFKLRGLDPKSLKKNSLGTPGQQRAAQAMALFGILIPPTYKVAPKLLVDVVLLGMRLNARFGVDRAGPSNISFFGIALIHEFKKIQLGKEFIDRALEFAKDYGDHRVMANTQLHALAFGSHRYSPLVQNIPELRSCFEFSMQWGYHEMAAYAAFFKVQRELLIGKNVNDCRKEMLSYFQLFKNINLTGALGFCGSGYALSKNLEEPGFREHNSFTCDIYNEEESLQRCLSKGEDNDPFILYCQKLYLCCLYDLIEPAKSYLEKLDVIHQPRLSFSLISYYFFHGTLIRFKLLDMLRDLKEQKHHLKKIHEALKTLKYFAEHVPEDHLYKVYIIEALLDFRKNNFRSAIKSMGLAEARLLTSTNVKGIYQNELGLLYKTLAQFWLHIGNRLLFKAYLEQSIARFSQWGANGVAYYLRGLVNDESIDAPRMGNKHTQNFSSVDQRAFIEAARSMSSDIEWEKVAKNVISVMMKLAGMNRGMLFLCQSSDITLQKIFKLEDNTMEIVSETVPDDRDLQSDAVQAFVYQCAQKKAATYVSRQNGDKIEKIQSALALPMISGSELVGIIYLETENSYLNFSEENIEMLQVLATQASSTFKNSMLYVQLQSFNKTLEKKVKERTADLRKTTEELELQVQQTQKNQKEKEKAQAELLSQSRLAAVGEVAAGVAHEINNPIHVISISMSLLKRAKQKEKLTDQLLFKTLDSIEETVTRISKIISGLQVVSREQDHESFAETSFKEILEDCLAIFSTKIRAQGVSLKTDLKFNSLYEDSFFGKRVQLAQVLVNLLNNAYQAVEHKKVREIELCLDFKEDSFFFTISDSGPGVLLQHESVIFEPFFTTRPVGKGTGLGLSLSRTIAESHYGSLSYQRIHDKTVFTLMIPKNYDMKLKNQGPMV